eukprot:m.1404860 g.1404860  ORF g.1404860 m.1404860 type:complete len:181 (+) comp25012_c0_seq64:679-1221(+)
MTGSCPCMDRCDTATSTSVLSCLPLIDCLSAWGRQDDVLKIVHTWLQQSFADEDACSTAQQGSKKGTKPSKTKGSMSPQTAPSALLRTSLALECLDRVVHSLALQQQTPALRASKGKRKGSVSPATAKLLIAVSDTLGGCCIGLCATVSPAHTLVGERRRSLNTCARRTPVTVSFACEDR